MVEGDASVQLTPEQEQAFLAWLGEHVEHGCAVCGGAEWATAQELYAPILYRATEGRFDGDAGVPCAMAHCSDCGHVMLFNAEVIGLI